MKPSYERMREYVHYHNTGDAGCNEVMLAAWADKHGLGVEGRFELAYLFSLTYCVASGVYLFCHRDEIRRDPLPFADQAKSRLIFQSDRKYVRIGNRFERALEQFSHGLPGAKHLVDEISGAGAIRLTEVISVAQGWWYFARFSAYLFAEALSAMLRLPVENTVYDWKHGDTATSGMMNLFCHDEEADEFDRSGHLMVPVEALDGYLDDTISNIRASGGDGNLAVVESTLCAYRKFYKGSRYNGYYLDRMLEELHLIKSINQDIDVNELFELRKQCFPARILGEASGWSGVRKPLKKHYIKTGRIND